MIIVKNRELLIPENERYIGTNYDAGMENRLFRVPRYSQSGTDLSDLTFKINLIFEGDPLDRAEMTKAVDDDYIYLTWTVTEAQVAVTGTIFVCVTGNDTNDSVKWSSFQAPFYTEKSLGDDIDTAYHNLVNKVAKEITDRKSAVSAEKSAREAADTTLQQNINAEASARAAGDAAVNTRIDNIVAQSGDDITEIVDARTGADSTVYASLKARLDSEHTDLKSHLEDTDNDVVALESIVGNYDYNESYTTLSGIIWDGTKYIASNANFNSFILTVNPGVTVETTVTGGNLQTIRKSTIKPKIGTTATMTAISTVDPFINDTDDRIYLMATFVMSGGTPSISVHYYSAGLVKEFSEVANAVETLKNTTGDAPESYDFTSADFVNLIWDGTKIVAVASTSNYNSFVVKIEKGKTISQTVDSGVALLFNVFDQEPIVNRVMSPVATIGINENYTATDKDYWMLYSFNLVSPNPSPVMTVNLTGNGLVEDVAILQNNVFRNGGMSLVCLGDSIFGMQQGATSIPYYIEQYTGATVYNCALGGTKIVPHTFQTDTWPHYDFPEIAQAIVSGDFSTQLAHLNDDGVPGYFADVIARLQSIDFSEIDVLSLCYGSNDYPQSATLADFKTYMQTGLSAIMTAYPNLRLLFVGSPYKFFMENGQFVDDCDTREFITGVTLIDYVNTMGEVATEYHSQMANPLMEQGINRYNRAIWFLPNDGSHPNQNGRLMMGKLVASYLERM